MEFQRKEDQLDGWLTVQYIQLETHCFFFFLYPSTVDQEDNLKDLISKGCALQNISIRDGRRTTKKRAV